MRESLDRHWNFPMDSIKGILSGELKHEFSERSTLHGVTDLYNAQHPIMRLIWAVLLVCALVGAVYGTYEIFVDFKNRPVVVSYFVREQEQGMTLPDVIVCPFNRFNKTFLDRHGVTGDLAQYMELAFFSPAIHSFQHRRFRNLRNRTSDLESLLQRTLTTQNFTFTTFVKAALLSCDDVIAPTDFVDCARVTDIISSAGRCFRIPGKLQKGIGFSYGIRVIVRLPTDIFVPGVNQILADGVAIKLAEHTRGLGSDLLFLPSGVHALVTLKATAYEFMNDPPRYSCSSSSTSHLRCFEQCLIAPAELFCNCSLVASSEQLFDYCTWFQISTCIYPQLFSANESECRARCRPPCKYVDYQASITYATFPPSHLGDFLEAEDDVNLESLGRHIILEVFFQNMEMLFIKHVVSMTPFSFVAQIGGQVSLWMGASILTCVQLGVFLAKFGHFHFRSLLFSKKFSTTRTSTVDHKTSGSLSQIKYSKARDDCCTTTVETFTTPPTSNCTRPPTLDTKSGDEDDVRLREHSEGGTHELNNGDLKQRHSLRNGRAQSLDGATSSSDSYHF